MSTAVTLGEQVTVADSFLDPAESWATITNLNNHINFLKADIARQANNELLRSTPEGNVFGADWIIFGRDWAPWYAGIPHGGSGTVGGVIRALSGSEAAQLRIFISRYNALDRRAANLGVEARPVGNPDPGEQWSVPTVAWVGLGVVALGLVAWIVTVSAPAITPWSVVGAERFRTTRTFPAMAGLRGKPARRRR